MNKYSVSNDKDTNNKLDKIKKELSNLIEVSSIQGLPQVFKTKRFGFKLMWVIFLVSSSVTCSYYAINSLVEFFNYEYFTSIKTFLQLPTPFPAISICSYEIKDFQLNILSMVYKTRRLKDWQTHFEPFYDKMYGDCYRFNSGKDFHKNTIDIKNSTSSGFYFGFWLELYVNSTKDFAQLIVYIHNQSDVPISLYNKGFYVSSGSVNYFVIDRFFEKKLPMPYNHCYEDVKLFPLNRTLIDFILNKNQTYTQEGCIDLCRTLHYIETNNNCPGCTLTSYDDNIYAKCAFNLDHNVRECALKAIENFQEDGPYKLCSQYCPLECDSSSLEVYQIYEDLPSTGNTTSFNYPEFNTYENVSKNYFGLYFYYDDLKYTLITQQPKMQPFDLVSSMGGLFGLFLGMGLLSFFEIFHIFLEVIIILVRN